MNKLVANLSKLLRTQPSPRSRSIRQQTAQARRWITAHSSKKWDSTKLIRAIRDAQ